MTPLDPGQEVVENNLREQRKQSNDEGQKPLQSKVAGVGFDQLLPEGALDAPLEELGLEILRSSDKIEVGNILDFHLPLLGNVENATVPGEGEPEKERDGMLLVHKLSALVIDVWAALKRCKGTCRGHSRG